MGEGRERGILPLSRDVCAYKRGRARARAHIYGHTYGSTRAIPLGQTSNAVFAFSLEYSESRSEAYSRISRERTHTTCTNAVTPTYARPFSVSTNRKPDTRLPRTRLPVIIAAYVLCTRDSIRARALRIASRFICREGISDPRGVSSATKEVFYDRVCQCNCREEVSFKYNIRDLLRFIFATTGEIVAMRFNYKKIRVIFVFFARKRDR